MIDESRWNIHLYPAAQGAVQEASGFDRLMKRHREKSAQSKGTEKSLLRYLRGGGFVSTVFVTNEGTFIMRTIWGEHAGLFTEVMLPDECPYEDLVRLARQREKALGN